MLTVWAVAIAGAEAWPQRPVPRSASDPWFLICYNPGTKQLVWTGRATKTIDPNNSQEKKQKNLNNAMKKLLNKFPPKQ